ncbi:MAG TPA: hypothetical protein VGJ32_07350 [Solirubrobacteraceae bacterium]
MSRRLVDPFLAAVPLVVAGAATTSPLAGVVALVVLLALAARWALPRRRRRGRRRGPSVVAVAPLRPRRPRPRARISVAAVAGRGPGVRALRPAELHEGRVRRAAARRRVADPALRLACLGVATRANARLTAAAAVRLGLADAPLDAPAASDPDPILLAAAWPAAA